jgi:hypothetical protein
MKNCNIYHRYEAIMAEKNNHTQNEAVASFLQTASAIVKPPASSGSGSFNIAPQRKMPAADVVIHVQKRGRIIELAGLQPNPAISPELLQVLARISCFCLKFKAAFGSDFRRNFSMLLFLRQTSGTSPLSLQPHFPYLYNRICVAHIHLQTIN